MFTPSKMLQKYMSAQPRDMFDIVGALMGYINADPQFKTNEFEQAIQYVLNNGVSESELFTTFDESVDFETDSTKWNQEYYSLARVYLKDNFCKKRIAHVKAVAKKLYPSITKEKSIKSTPDKKDQESQQKRGAQSNGKKRQTNRSNKSKRQKEVVIIMVMTVILLVVMLMKMLIEQN